MTKYYIILSMGVALATLGQIFLKIGANRFKQKLTKSLYINKFTILGYSVFVLVTLLNTYALGKVDIKMMNIFVPIGFMMVLASSVIFLKEKISRQQIIGILVVLTGIGVYLT